MPAKGGFQQKVTLRFHRSGFPIRTPPSNSASWQLLEAYRSLVRPSSAQRPKASTVYINIFLFDAFISWYPVFKVLRKPPILKRIFRPNCCFLSFNQWRVVFCMTICRRQIVIQNGGPGGNRSRGLCIANAALWPTELQARDQIHS